MKFEIKSYSMSDTEIKEIPGVYESTMKRNERHDFPILAIVITSLEQLVGLSEIAQHGIVIDKEPDHELPSIELYDDYRE